VPHEFKRTRGYGVNIYLTQDEVIELGESTGTHGFHEFVFVSKVVVRGTWAHPDRCSYRAQGNVIGANGINACNCLFNESFT